VSAVERPADPNRLVELDTGVLTAAQVNLLIDHLPFDISFADERDTLCLFTSGPAYQDCNRETIGGSVQACHSARSLPALERMLMEFRTGRDEPFVKFDENADEAEYVRYFPVRDARGAYRGVLEVIEDATHVRSLRGESRLKVW
jgi:DUF438 domain-containing protein